MKLADVMSDAGRTGRYPVILTDVDFVIAMFNDAAKRLFDGIEEGRPFDDFAEIYDKRDLQRSRYPSSALIRVSGKPYLCAFCPVFMGFHKEFVITVAVPDKSEQDDSELFLSMKLAVLSKCMDMCGENVPPSAKKAYDKLYSSYEANMRMIISMSRIPTPSAVYIKELLGDAFSYYCRTKYGGEDRKRYDIIADDDIMIVNNILCVIVMTSYNLGEKLSSNGYCRVALNEDRLYDKMIVSVDFKPKSKLVSAISHYNDVEDAIYQVLGRAAEDVYFIKSLSAYLFGKVKLTYDENVVSIKIITPREKGKVVRARSLDFKGALYAAADRVR